MMSWNVGDFARCEKRDPWKPTGDYGVPENAPRLGGTYEVLGTTSSEGEQFLNFKGVGNHLDMFRAANFTKAEQVSA